MFNIFPLSAAVSGGAAVDGSAVPLSSRFSQAYVWAGKERDALLASANNPAVASDPALLYAHQVRQEDYIKQLALSSALVSHATKGIETLVKS
ncbi:hypothetical protein [Stenotrophomonas sp. CFBP 13718]|uniref:hypothetical protein n=1 Tax=Stenotrophomonas sp. CFBP 13718 TaxID=2775304 RepID=UPI00177A8A9D|nr:hypothetical protein [Stenotrophomonas sp. CFBP 13718]MBD8697308.1 hypothetical protein [Stenotrophomonas sp. CFBP 13718]